MLGRQFNKVIKEWIGTKDQMSRTSHLTSISQMSLEEKGLKKNPLKGMEYNVMNMKVLVTLELNVLHILRNRRRIYLLLGLKRTQSDLEESAKYVKALTGKYVSDEESSDGELTFNELDASYKELCLKSA